MVEFNNKNSVFAKIQIHLASRKELQIIHDLAHQIWPITYAKIITLDQINYMLNWMYALEVLQGNYDAGQDFFIAYENDRPLGFMALEYGYENASTVKLQKLYVLPELHGRGVGKLLVDQAKEVCVAKNYHTIVLNVNKHNPAYQFYLKQGFTVEREEVFDIGNGFVMDDYIMAFEMGN